MRISEAWLREYVNPDVSTDELVEQLTMAGLEVDSVQSASAVFTGVVVGEVLAMEQHPDADRLSICRVSAGQQGQDALQIVCGASNVRVGLKVPVALVDAELPGDFKIKKSKLRGVESHGMLCSEKELGLEAESDGLMELAADAPVGVNIRDYLSLNDNIIEVDLTPNRADCLSVEGIAREVAVLNRMDWAPVAFSAKESVYERDALTISVEAPNACPRYLGRFIRDVNVKAETPLWMQERLRRCGLRSLGPVVDVTNYVLIELGQPLHAFDADKVSGGICVRMAASGETLSLLNGQTISLEPDTLVIADNSRALALGGIMGGSESAVGDDTNNIILECAFFSPQSIVGKARKYGLHTDSSHRFERGVDPALQKRAIERATQLIVDIAGGKPGVIAEIVNELALPKSSSVFLRRQSLETILGLMPEEDRVVDILQRLGMQVVSDSDGWSVTPPSFRFDIAIEADLIEEIARIVGYNNLPNRSLLVRSDVQPATEKVVDLERVKDLLVDRGYQEAITYSFVDEAIQKAVAPEIEWIPVSNPISSEMSVMRTTLWCGLLKAALHNVNRQHDRVRLFETGLRFTKKNGQIQQDKMLAGLVLGNALAEQWGEASRKVDFFDVKADLEAIFALTGSQATFQISQDTALHPGQCADVFSETGEAIGVIGMLHPNLEKSLGFDSRVFLFELDQNILLKKHIPQFEPLSKYPSVRRDMALIVREPVTADQIVNCIHGCNETTLKDIIVFDVYRGKGIDAGYKSVALSMNFQDDLQTLTDSEIDAIFSRILNSLKTNISAKLRD